MGTWKGIPNKTPCEGDSPPVNAYTGRKCEFLAFNLVPSITP